MGLNLFCYTAHFAFLFLASIFVPGFSVGFLYLFQTMHVISKGSKLYLYCSFSFSSAECTREDCMIPHCDTINVKVPDNI